MTKPKRTRRVYIVLGIKKSHEVELIDLIGENIKVPVSLSWAESMIGVCPVFTNKRKAQRYAGKNCPVITGEVEL